MKRITPLIALMLLLAVPMTAHADPAHYLSGYVMYPNGTSVGSGANITFTNQATGEIIYTTTVHSGAYIQDAANFPSGYSEGDMVQYYTVFGGYANTTSAQINPAAGPTELGITVIQCLIRDTTDTHQETINESAYNQFDAAMMAANPSWTDFTDALAKPYLLLIGSIFYLFVFGLPLLMIYIRQDSINVPATFMFLFGSFMTVLLPPQWQIIGRGLLALALLGAIYSFMKERERG